MESIQKAITNLATAKEATDEEVIRAARKNLKLARAVDSVKHLLNFYEFVAVGVKYGDLDESMLYETISVAIVSLFDRTAPYREFIQARDGANQVLAFEHLTEMVNRWRARLNNEEAVAKNTRQH